MAPARAAPRMSTRGAKAIERYRKVMGGERWGLGPTIPPPPSRRQFWAGPAPSPPVGCRCRPSPYPSFRG